MAVVLPHFLTDEVFLGVGFGLLLWFEPDFSYLGEFPALAVTAPLSSLWVIGTSTCSPGSP